MPNLEIDKEFQRLIPPLQDTEFKQLAENIKVNGCQDSLKVWNGTIVDGHNRYKICTEHDIPFEVSEMNFSGKNEAIVWIIKNQFGRRNLLPFQRSELALKMKETIRAKAKGNCAAGGGDKKTGLQKSANPIQPTHTSEEIAKLAGVSHSTISQAEAILKKGTPEQQERARTGGKGNSVNAVYTEVIHGEATEKKCSKCGQVLPIDRFYGGRNTCKSCCGVVKASEGVDRNLIDQVCADVRNYTPREYTASDLSEELTAMCVDFTSKFKTVLTLRSVLLSSADGKEKAIAALLQAEAAIKNIKEIIS